MIDRNYLESKHNWQATVLIVRTGKMDCLMRTIHGGYYWHSPSYDGMFAWGATRTFVPSLFADALDRGLIELLSGTLPGREPAK